MMKEYQVNVNISFGLPLRIRAESGQEATDRAHEILMAMNDLGLLELIKGAQFRYGAYWDTRKVLTEKEVEQMREGQEGKE